MDPERYSNPPEWDEAPPDGPEMAAGEPQEPRSLLIPGEPLLDPHQWLLREAGAAKAGAFARALARLYLVAPEEAEKVLEKLLHQACWRAGLDPANLAREVSP